MDGQDISSKEANIDLYSTEPKFKENGSIDTEDIKDTNSIPKNFRDIQCKYEKAPEIFCAKFDDIPSDKLK